VFRIGDFSRIARVSCRLLRYYDEIGLLEPATVERDTGYRYYSASQLPRLNRILVLKELGLSLEQIAQVIRDGVSAAELRGMLVLRRAEVEREVAAQSERLRQIETRVAQIDAEGQLFGDDVVIRSEPPRRFLSARRAVGSFAEARGMLKHVIESIRGQLPRDALGPVMVIAHAQEFEPDDLDVELGVALAGPGEVRLEGLAVRELPAVERMAACVRVGLPEQAHLITSKIGQFVESSGCRLAGPVREVFLEPPRFERMQESVVEMQFPIEPDARDEP